MLHYIFKSQRKKKILFLISSTGIHYRYWCTCTLTYEQNSSRAKAKRIVAFTVFVVGVSLFSETNIWQTLHLEIMCSSCHLWLYSLNLFHSNSVCIATLLILHCCWLQWKLNFSIPHSCFFTHEWGAAVFLNITCQKSHPSWDHVLMMLCMECISLACDITPCYYFLCCDILCVFWSHVGTYPPSS